MRRVRSLLLALLFAALFCVLVGGISAVQRRMNEIRRNEKLTDTEPLENAPPVVAFTTIALGGFRGLVADWLWLRSAKMQENGNYFEMYQLASWIVKLQPRFTGATSFLAWNMSYNISVTFNGFEDRWRWVQRGIELIRDEALRYNPGDPELYRELGWIYQHKLGKDLDDANRYYKTQLAKQMIAVIGDPPVDWAGLASTPTDLTELCQQDGVDLEAAYSALQAGEDNALDETFRSNGVFPESVNEALEALKPGFAGRVELMFSSRWLRQVYKLDPAQILTLNQTYGDLDWRLPEAHAIYWASKGLGAADDELVISCDRMVFQSLAAAFRGGRLVHLSDIEHLEWTPNIDLVDAVDRSYLDAMSKHDADHVKPAYGNFLVDAVVILYTFGRRAKAQEYFEKGRADYASRFYKTLDEFVLRELAGDMAAPSLPQAQGTIQGYLRQVCYALALGETERAVTFEQIASKLWTKYDRFIGNTKERRALPPYKQMKKSAVSEALTYFPDGLKERLRQALREAGEEIEQVSDPSGAGTEGQSGE